MFNGNLDSIYKSALTGIQIRNIIILFFMSETKPKILILDLT